MNGCNLIFSISIISIILYTFKFKFAFANIFPALRKVFLRILCQFFSIARSKTEFVTFLLDRDY